MTTFDTKIQALESVRDNIGSYIKDIIELNEEAILYLNSYTQLYHAGETSKGIFIADYAPYKNKTIAIKQSKNQPVDRVTLRDTGDFYKSFFIVATNTDFTISASDSKTDELTFKYGEDILGLSDENMSIVAQDYIHEALITKIKTTI